MKRAAICLVFVLAALSGAWPAGAVDTVVYGFDKNFLPYSFVRTRESVGFEVDLLEAIFDDSGMKLEKRPMEEWERVQAELSSNTLQISSGMTRTELRQKLFIFPERENLTLRGRFFTRKEDRKPLAEDLRGQSVAVKKGSVYHTRAQNFGGFKVYAYENDEAALKAMWMGETVAYFGPDKTAYWYVEQEGLDGVAAVGRPVDETHMFFAFYKGQTALRDFVNKRLGELRRNGVYDRIYRKWFVPELTPEERDGMIEAAKQASRKSFAPYSGKHTGAAALSRTGEIYTGCSIESHAPISGVSALQAAISAAVAAGDTELRAVVLTDGNGSVRCPGAPLRPLLQEFGRGLLVLVEPEPGEYDSIMISRLTPFSEHSSP